MTTRRMTDNDKIVTRYMDDQDFQNTAFPILAKAIFDTIVKKAEIAPHGTSEAVT